MKKNYIKPGMDIFKMGVANIVCTSPGVNNSTPADPSQPSLGKELPDFGDFEEDFDINNLLLK